MDRWSSMGKEAGEDGSVRVSISDIRQPSKSSGSSNTALAPFEPPHSGIEKRDSYKSASPLPSPVTPAPPFSSDRAPEKKLTLFALRLAVLEKAASGLGTLGFIWATVVLLGGFAITLDKTDFWFITIILLIESTRIYSRSHELEWQHQATWSITDVGINSFRAIRSSSRSLLSTVKTAFKCRPIASCKSKEATELKKHRSSHHQSGPQRMPTRIWASSDVPFLPNWFFLSRNVSKLLYWLQLLSAAACMVLSLMKLIKHNYGSIEKGDTDKRNRNAALYIFYSLALAEALLFLMEKAYWEWKINFCKLLEKVAEECEFGSSGLISVRRFFYDSFSRCLSGSIFDGLNMDMISFSTELLRSDSPSEQLIGIRILRQFATKESFSSYTLQKIGTSIAVIDRLVEMLNWKAPQQEEIRKSSAEIMSKLVGKKQNSIRIAWIPGAMESISSLLQINRVPSGRAAADEIEEETIIFDNEHYGFWNFIELGLLILQKLARDPDNCAKMGNTRGLLPKIVDFTHIEERVLKDPNATDSKILTIKRSLKLLKMLAGTTGATGKQLRKDILEIISTISNIRGILRHGEGHPVLQRLGIEVLTSLATEENAAERIGGTGGVLKELLNIFFKAATSPEQECMRAAAGEALVMLALDSETNCSRILKLQVLPQLVEALEIRDLGISAARILRNLCACIKDGSSDQLKDIRAAAPIVLKAIVSAENKLQEVMMGLASQVFRFMTVQESRHVFEQAGIGELELAETLVHILRKYPEPHIKVPRIRRFTVELAIWMMKDDAANARHLRSMEFERDLEGILETTSEIECFNAFSGTVGLNRHRTTIHSLVETAMRHLQKEDEQGS
ncbi:hypothetical protein SAY87_021964 [Trapa incisa]|uniref:ARM repeat superfamily protein n=1 Tax=Trapa incisa TaxID=236973 RepID=A0AAN7PSQ1_9MYRT|nr:hypothetical protein SAY87_021964 [Trapa incisa]